MSLSYIIRFIIIDRVMSNVASGLLIDSTI